MKRIQRTRNAPHVVTALARSTARLRAQGPALANTTVAIRTRRLTQFSRSAVKKADAMGVESEADTLKLMFLVMWHGEDFEQLPWAKRLIEQGGLTPSALIAALWEAARDEPSWAELEAEADDEDESGPKD